MTLRSHGNGQGNGNGHGNGNTWGKGKRRRFGWELCWFEDGNTDSERRTPHSHKKKDTFEPWLESASFDSFVPVAVKPTLGKAGMAIPAAFWDTYCDAPPPRPTWAEHKAKLDRLRAEDDLTRGVPRRRKKKHLAQARAAAVSEVDSLPTANRTIKLSPAVYGTPSCAHIYDEVIRQLQLGSAPSKLELAFASAQRALYDTAASLAASWRADVASPPVGHRSVDPVAPGARGAHGGRQVHRGRGGQRRGRGVR